MVFPWSQAKPSQAKPSPAKPSQAKVLTKGGDLRETQVDIPLSVSNSCAWAHCWTRTDTFTLTGGYANANGMESGWGPWVIKQKTSADEALYLVGGKFLLWLVDCLGFELKLAIWVKIQALRWGLHAWGWECWPCPVFASNYTLVFTLQLRKITVNLSQGSRNVLGKSLLSMIRLVDLATD